MLIKVNILNFAVMTVFIRRFCFDNFLCCIFPFTTSLQPGQGLAPATRGGWRLGCALPGGEGMFVVAMGVARRAQGPTLGSQEDPTATLSPTPALRPGPSPPGKGVLRSSWPGVPFLQEGIEEPSGENANSSPPFLSSSWPFLSLQEKGREKSGFRCLSSHHQGFWPDISAGGAPQLVCPALCLVGQQQSEKGRVWALQSLSSRSHSFVRSFICSSSHSLIPHSTECHLCARVCAGSKAKRLLTRSGVAMNTEDTRPSWEGAGQKRNCRE